MSSTRFKIYQKENIRHVISEQDIERFIEIAEVYFPQGEVIRSIVRNHLAAADVVVVARKNNVIQGFSVVSVYTMQTPFSSKALPVIYHRMLFLSPDYLKSRIGMTLGVRSYRALLGCFWFAKYFVLFCRTMNPNVVKRIRIFNEYYPESKKDVPRGVFDFALSLSEILESPVIDHQLKLINTFSEFRDIDATSVWNDYLRSKCEDCEQIILDGAFTKESGRLIGTGNAQLLIGYNKPFGMLKLAFR